MFPCLTSLCFTTTTHLLQPKDALCRRRLPAAGRPARERPGGAGGAGVDDGEAAGAGPDAHPGRAGGGSGEERGEGVSGERRGEGGRVRWSLLP